MRVSTTLTLIQICMCILSVAFMLLFSSFIVYVTLTPLHHEHKLNNDWQLRLEIIYAYALSVAVKVGVIHAQKQPLPFHSLKKLPSLTKKAYLLHVHKDFNFHHARWKELEIDEQRTPRYTLNRLKRYNRLGPCSINTKNFSLTISL